MSVETQYLAVTNQAAENARLLGEGCYRSEAIAQSDDSIKLCAKKIRCLKGIIALTVVGGVITTLALVAFASPTSGYATAGAFGFVLLIEIYNITRLSGNKSTLKKQDEVQFTQIYLEVENFFHNYFTRRKNSFITFNKPLEHDISLEQVVNNTYHTFKFTNCTLTGANCQNVDIEILASRITKISYVPENQSAANALSHCKAAAEWCLPIPKVVLNWNQHRTGGRIESLRIGFAVTDAWGNHGATYQLTET